MKTLAIIIYSAAELISFFWSMAVIIDKLGFIGGLIAFLIIPLTIVFAPFYVGFATGNWTLLAITYGGGILAAVLFGLSKQE
jgi:hypothetical protein